MQMQGEATVVGRGGDARGVALQQWARGEGGGKGRPDADGKEGQSATWMGGRNGHGGDGRGVRVSRR